MNFIATKQPVEDQGRPPDAFLTELVEFGRAADEEIFAPNSFTDDVFNILAPILGNPRPAMQPPPEWKRWNSPLHRRAALLECMRVHAGFESGWRWSEGVDRTNRRSMANITGQETGIFQVSFDSEALGHSALNAFAHAHDIATPEEFISKMKTNHRLALEYYARLVRVSYKWAGPLIRSTGDSVRPYLSRAAVAEFETLLS